MRLQLKEEALAASGRGHRRAPEDRGLPRRSTQAEFPGVEVDVKAVRGTRRDGLAAHVLGYTGEISQRELDQSAFKAYELGDIVGKAGAEAAVRDGAAG